MKDITHYEKDIQVHNHQQELMRKAGQWRLTQNAKPRAARRRRAVPTFIIRVLAVLRLLR
jgi:hypothetical protein